MIYLWGPEVGSTASNCLFILFILDYFAFSHQFRSIFINFKQKFTHVQGGSWHHTGSFLKRNEGKTALTFPLTHLEPVETGNYVADKMILENVLSVYWPSGLSTTPLN